MAGILRGSSFGDSTEEVGVWGTLLETGTLGFLGWMSYGCIDATGKESGSAAGEVFSFVGGFLGVGLLLMSSDGCTAPDIAIWQDSAGDWHIGNDVPYSQVEHRAQQVYNHLHGQKNASDPFPALIAETPEAYDAVTKLFPNGGTDGMLRTLDVLEAALTAGAAQNEEAC